MIDVEEYFTKSPQLKTGSGMAGQCGHCGGRITEVFSGYWVLASSGAVHCPSGGGGFRHEPGLWGEPDEDDMDGDDGDDEDGVS